MKREICFGACVGRFFSAAHARTEYPCLRTTRSRMCLRLTKGNVMFVGLNPWKHWCKTDRCLKDCAVTLTDCWLHQCYIFHVWKGLLMFGEQKLEMAGRQTEREMCGKCLCSVILVQRSCQCVDAAAVCVWGQGLLCGHGWDIVGWRGLGGRTWHHIWHITHKNNRQNRKFSCIWQQHLHFLVRCYWNIHSQPLY